MLTAIAEASRNFPKPLDFKPSYGTAGFRAEANLLDSTIFRCGILMALRAFKAQQTTGICITASHNPAPDNGVKLVDPSGEMLQQRYEAVANELANTETDEALISYVKDLIEKERIVVEDASVKVLIAHDTRPSGPRLAAAAAAGVSCVGGHPEILGLLTTPQLHWIVMRTNQGQPAGEVDYYTTLSAAFEKIMRKSESMQTLHVDCAHGVGGPKLETFNPYLEKAGLRLIVHNTGDGILNGDCGSDYIQRTRCLPKGVVGIQPGMRCCAIDGDADRLVFFQLDPAHEGQIILLDGDKIAALVAGFIKDLVVQLPNTLKQAQVGVVQTAYANGASTTYLRDVIQCDVVVTPTGVKYLHEAAHAYDAGIYFEANGHGTVLFKSSFLTSLEAAASESTAAAELLAINGVINAAVGDAISGILLVEAALARKGWGLAEWAALYEDLPSRQIKVRVPDRSFIVTTDAERRVAEPKILQERIDAAVVAMEKGRCFVRPSGTEDVVRIYAEANTQQAADDLASAVGKIVEAVAAGTKTS